LQLLRVDPEDSVAAARFDSHQADLGYGLLLLRYVDDPAKATPQQMDAAAWSTVPNVSVLFWSFRFMVGIGMFLIALFLTAFYLSARQQLQQHRWFLRLAFCSLPLPWIAAELGWVVAASRPPPKPMCCCRSVVSPSSIQRWPWWTSTFWCA
jgi:cytochrome d ubiquinol oxidase subunit I